VAVRTRAEPLALGSTLRTLVSQLDPDLPAHQVLAMEQRIASSLTTERARMMLLTGFAALALLLAAVGLHGVLAYTVAQRTAEIGIRMALGSSAREVFAMVLREGARLLAIGLAIGLAGSYALARVVRSMLYGVEPLDPV